MAVKNFFTRNAIKQKLWRDDTAANSGVDTAGHRHELLAGNQATTNKQSSFCDLLPKSHRPMPDEDALFASGWV